MQDHFSSTPNLPQDWIDNNLTKLMDAQATLAGAERISRLTKTELINSLTEAANTEDPVGRGHVLNAMQRRLDEIQQGEPAE